MTFCFIQFRQNDVRANDVSRKRRSAERHFVKMTFGWQRFGKMTFGWTTIRKIVVRHYEVSLIRRFGHVMIRSNNFRQFFFGKITLWQNCISAKRRFHEMTFRVNDVTPDIFFKSERDKLKEISENSWWIITRHLLIQEFIWISWISWLLKIVPFKSQSTTK